MTTRHNGILLALVLAAAALLGGQTSAVTIDWVTVEGGGPGGPGVGGVDYTYQIGRYEVTNAQYAEFLNAVADADPNALYSPWMGEPVPQRPGGIARSGSSGSYTYSAIAGRENQPVSFVSFYDALRFANWLHNGQPTGPQGNATTEDGAYTITAAGIAANSITRNAGATIFLTSDAEWYKAAYYDAASTSFFDYPTRSNTRTVCATPGATANTANCSNVVGDLTAVGSYTGAASPSGTLDQGGNVEEWTEKILRSGRTQRGGNFGDFSDIMHRDRPGSPSPDAEASSRGFRVASVPEPGAGLLVLTGMLGLSIWRRRRA